MTDSKNEISIQACVTSVFKWVMISFLIIFFGFIGFSAIIAKFSVWRASQEGQAELNKADWNRQIVVREAQARKDASTLLAEAEIERAKGVAKANAIIGESLKGNESYLKYLWIDSLQHTNDKVIYIPTEAGLPILEARSK